MFRDPAVVLLSCAPAARIQAWARELVATRPPLPTPASLADDRYWLTDLLDDFRDERTPAELRAIACKLYPMVSNFVLKSQGHWQGTGKTLPRLVERAAPDLGRAIESAFESFFKTGERSGVLSAVQQVLAPFGGELFDGFRSDAPTSFRAPRSELPWLRS